MKLSNIFLRGILSLLLVLSTGGFSTYAHFCKGELVSGSVLLPVDPCGGEEGKSCKMPVSEEGIHKKCCEDLVMFLQTAPVKTEDQIDSNAPDFNAIFSPFYTGFTIEAGYSYFLFQLPEKPPLIRPLYVWFENFRL